MSDYVKNGCTSAQISITVRSHNNHTETITREFNVNEKTQWMLNGQGIGAKDVIEFTKKYNIQVDNLCQFLPQEKVQLFAQLNKQNLLLQTLLATGRSDIIDAQKELVDLYTNQTDLEKNLKSQEERLQQLKDENFRIKGKVSIANFYALFKSVFQHFMRNLKKYFNFLCVILKGVIE